jgi:hypothetical protein
VISGDHERTALDFQKHYRQSSVYLMDTDVSLQAAHSRGGWPFLMLVDPNGTIVRKVNNMVDGDPEILKALQRMKAAPDAAPIRIVDGVHYSSETLRRSGELDKPRVREHSSHLAATPDGRVFLVFTSWRGQSSDVWWRVWDGKSWSEDRAVAASDADEYDGTVVTAPDNQVWFCWTSNAGGDKYNIFATSLDRLTKSKRPIQVTQSDDDAMGGRLVMDATGTLWITYYKWQKNAQGISRDKEVFVRTLRNEALSQETQVSPTDVPDYEDHTDPALVLVGDRALVSWSWDYHRPKGYTQEPESPTIFLRAVDADLKLGKPFHASGRSIDMVPVLAVQDKAAWCAWDSLILAGDSASKSLQVRRVKDTGCDAETISLATGLEHICSPCFALSPQGRMALVWCQKKRGGSWELRRSDCDDQGQWSISQALVTTGNPRYGSATFDTQGHLWLSYTADTENGRQIKVQQP